MPGVRNLSAAADARAIDLPCIGTFPIQDSNVNLELAIEQTACKAFGVEGMYSLQDGSIVEVRFEGPGDGQLIEAAWYWPPAGGT